MLGSAAHGTLAGLLAGGRIVAARPALFGGIAIFSVTAGLVADNALNRQAGRHPHPMLVTRADEGGESGRGSTKTAGAARTAARPPIQNDPRIVAFPLVRDVQALLAEQGYYKAEIDGRAGQATDMAIRAFQKERGLRVDGMATPLLLTQIRQAVDAEDEAPDGRFASLEPATDMGTTGGIASDATDSDLVRRIQAKLSEAKVADIRADGILGERTRAAIRTFQALESLDVTGEPSVEVLERLSAVSAGR